MRIKLDAHGIMPERAHSTDAGLDLMADTEIVLGPRDSVAVDTGVHVQLPPGTCGILVSKSGLYIRHGITSTGLIDEGYTGSIIVGLHNQSRHEVRIRRGDKISQLVVVPCLYEPVEIVDEIDGGERGDQGFGSTGR